MTLLEGSVRIQQTMANDQQSIIVKPGQQPSGGVRFEIEGKKVIVKK